MIHRLIPEFILQKSKEGNFSGNFQAAVLFIDIVGFTSVTEELMKNGKEGAEILSEIITIVFSRCIDSVYELGGFISTFAGDAFTAIFPKENSQNIITAALEIKNSFNNMTIQKTKFGSFRIYFKIGLSAGNVDWRIIKNPIISKYYFKGNAIEQSVMSQKKSGSNEIILDEKLNRDCKIDIIYEEKRDGYYLLKSSKFKAEKSISRQKIFPDQSDFIKRAIFDLNIVGEFREIIPCFIIFEDPANWQAYISKLITTAEKFGGYFKDINIDHEKNVALIYFGIPVGIEKIFDRALDFALVCRNDFKGKMKFGLTFGAVFSGFIENKRRSEYLAMGKIVNLAARFCVQTDWNTIRIDENIFKNSRLNYSFEYLGDLDYKGFSKKIPSSILLEKRIETEVSTSLDPVFGREKELQKLKNSIKPLQHQKFAGIIYVHGIAGIGKSRLVNEFRKTIIPLKDKRSILKKELLADHSKTGFGWFFLPCNEIIQTSFHPVTQFLKEYFQQSEKNSEQQNKSNFEKIFKSLTDSILNMEIRDELIRIKSILGALVNLFWKNSLYEQLDSKGKYQNILYAFKKFIKANCLLKPVIIEIEDAHWIDDDSIKMLEILTRNIEDYPFFLIAACRLKDDGSQFNFNLGNIKTTDIVLEFLERQSADSLINEKLGRKASPGLLDLIWEKSEGNPFYIEQIILYLKENNLIKKNRNLFHLNPEIDISTFTIPSTINAIIIARIDKLTTELKNLVKTASVLGREFAIDVLSTMLKQKPIKDTLLEGDRENIWTALSEILYIFKHSLIRESIYQMQLKKHLRELHKLAGETIETLYKENPVDHFAELADHFDKAEVPNKAIFYYEKAGDIAKENYQNEIAIERYDRLLKNIKKTAGYIELKINILIRQGVILKLIGKWDKSEKNFIKANELSKQNNFHILMIKSGNSLGSLKKSEGDYKIALQIFNKNLELSESFNYLIGIIHSNQNIGDVYTQQDVYDKAIKFLDKALISSQKIKSKKNTSSIYASLGIVHKKMGNYKLAMSYYQKKIKICTEIGDIRGVYYTYTNIGNILLFQGEYEQAESNFLNSITSAKKIGDIYAVGLITANLGIVYMNRKDYTKAMKFYQEGLEISKEINDNVGIGIILGNMGIVYSKTGKYEKAMDCYQKRLEVNEETGDKSGTAFAYGNIGNVFSDKGEYEKAILAYQKMLKISQDIGYKIGITLAKANIGGVFANMKEYSKALSFLNQSIELEKELDLKDYLVTDLEGKAKILIRLNKFAEAKKICDENLQVSAQVNNGKPYFDVLVQARKVDFLVSKNSSERLKIISSLEAMLNEGENEKDRAELYFELAYLNKKIKQIVKAKKYKKLALESFIQLFKKIPNHDFKNRIDELEKNN